MINDGIPYFIGFDVEPVECFDRFLPPICAPSNYKDEEKIETYIAKRRGELEVSAPQGILTGRISGFTIISADKGDTIYGVTARELATAFRVDLRVEFNDKSQHFSVSPGIVGFEVRDRLRQAAIELASQGEDFPAWFWRATYVDLTYGVTDPIKMLGVDKNSRDSLLLRLGIEADLSNSLGLALAAKALYRKFM